jgi:hypothetical protein
LESIAPSTF